MVPYKTNTTTRLLAVLVATAAILTAAGCGCAGDGGAV
jgi:hypothetical protein